MTASVQLKKFLAVSVREQSSRPALGSTLPSIQWISEALSPEVKRSGREADHSPPVSAEVKKMWIYTATPPYALKE
jgi:hypothetical protein